jgi:hypothetical protein
VNVTATSETTYYETLGWNQGGDAGGYTGIQSTPNGPTFIFSIWDPVDKNIGPIKSLYQKPGSKTEAFGNEGTGLHYIDTTTRWQINNPVTMLVRSWSVGGHTHFGMWSLDQAKQIWTHHTTFDFPKPNMYFEYGANSFLENYGNSKLSTKRQAFYYNGWKRSSGNWFAFTQANGDSANQFGVSDNKYFLQTGVPTATTENPLQASTKGNKPSVSRSVVNGFVATYRPSKNSVDLQWDIDDKNGPQFSYTAELVEKQTRRKIAQDTKVSPQARSVSLLVPNGFQPSSVQVNLVVTNIIDLITSVAANVQVITPANQEGVSPFGWMPALQR